MTQQPNASNEPGAGSPYYDPNLPTGGGNFNPEMRIDLSHASVAPPPNTTRNPIDAIIDQLNLEKVKLEARRAGYSTTENTAYSPPW